MMEKIKNQMALEYYERHIPEIKTIILNAFIEGYSQGYYRAREVTINRVTFYDLGLPSGTLWSRPICEEHPWTYVTYKLSSYYDVCDLPLPTLDDLQELIRNCRIDCDNRMVSKDVSFLGPSGKRIGVGTKDYLNRPDNPNSVMCLRKGEGVGEYENMFWIKSDVIDNCATVAVVNFNERTISISKHFTGYKLPCILVKKP